MSEKPLWKYKIYLEPIEGHIYSEASKEEIESFIFEDHRMILDGHASISHIDILKEKQE